MSAREAVRKGLRRLGVGGLAMLHIPEEECDAIVAAIADALDAEPGEGPHYLRRRQSPSVDGSDWFVVRDDEMGKYNVSEYLSKAAAIAVCAALNRSARREAGGRGE